MKRNKPIWKHRKPGTQARLRYPHWRDREGAVTWTVIVPQAIVGVEARTFSMDGAVPSGHHDRPDDPRVTSGAHRWILDGSMVVYAKVGGLSSWDVTYGFEGVPRIGDVWYAFTAGRECLRNPCPLTHYWYEGPDATLKRHRKGFCPLAVSGEGVWKYAGRMVL